MLGTSGKTISRAGSSRQSSIIKPSEFRIGRSTLSESDKLLELVALKISENGFHVPTEIRRALCGTENALTIMLMRQTYSSSEVSDYLLRYPRSKRGSRNRGWPKGKSRR